MINRRILLIVPVLVSGLFAETTLADDIKAPPVPSALTSKGSNISGNVKIHVNAGKIQNLIMDGSNNQAHVRLGSIRNSTIKGNGDINVEAGNIINTVSGNNNMAVIRAGSIENSEVGSAKISVKAKNISNEVRGGSNNKSMVNLGSIVNSKVKGKANIDIEVTNDIKMAIIGGSDNTMAANYGSVLNQSVDSFDFNGKFNHIENTIENSHGANAKLNLGVVGQ